ncbi:5911_t:CDS:2, partial [Funneliformis mosseae]
MATLEQQFEILMKEYKSVNLMLNKHQERLYELEAKELTSAKIKEILDKYVHNVRNSRKSLSNSENIPNDTLDISTYLKFVSRENAIVQLMNNMSNLHQLVTNPGEYAEPLKNLYFAAAVGTAGKGKTTFARRAYENEDKYYGVVRPEIAVAVKNCIYAGRSFRIACDSFTMHELKEEPEAVFGLRLLYEAMKYKLGLTEISTYENFRDKFKGHTIALNEILDVILSYFPNEDNSLDLPLIIINIDETNSIFERNKDIFLKEVFKSLSDMIFRHYFIFPVLTGTHASSLFCTVKSTNAKIEEIYLPLLKTNHAKEVILELANREQNKDSAECILELSVYLEYIIELLGVVGRFLEILIFQMGVIGYADMNHHQYTTIKKFYYAGFRHFLQKLQNNPKFCEILIKRTKEIIHSKYNHYFDHFKKEENTEIIPLLVAYSLFDIGISRVESIGTKKKRKFEELEQEDIIFIDKNLDGKHSIRLPFLILHELYSQHRNPCTTPEIKLLESLDIALSPDENERVTLSVFVFRLWTIYHTTKNERNDGLFQCKLSRLVPLRNGQKDRVLKFHPWFSVRDTLDLITKENWKSFIHQVQNQQQQRYKE